MNAESSQQFHVRKSSFLCYVSMITMIKKLKSDKPSDYTDILDKIIHNILQSFKDDDPKIVHAGAECLYNTISYYRESVLPNFNSYLEGLICLMTINDPEVKEIAQNLDSILKGVISYTFQGQLPDNFNLLNFFKIIIEKLQLKHPDIKRNIVSWISWINQIPEIKLINVLQMFLPELFNMLSDSNNDVQKSAEDCLQDFYDEIEISENASMSHFKSAMQIRNKEMVDRSDLVICYIERNSGGAYQTIEYAKKQNKRIINLAEEIEEDN